VRKIYVSICTIQIFHLLAEDINMDGSSDKEEDEDLPWRIFE
jgi:hypothetical protein